MTSIPPLVAAKSAAELAAVGVWQSSERLADVARDLRSTATSCHVEFCPSCVYVSALAGLDRGRRNG